MKTREEQMMESLRMVDEYNRKLKKICSEINMQGGKREDDRHKRQGLRTGY